MANSILKQKHDGLLAGFIAAHHLLHRADAPLTHWRMHLANLKTARRVCTHLVAELDKLIVVCERRIAEFEALDKEVKRFSARYK